MNLTVISVLLMLIVAYSFWREGVLTAFCMFVNVFIAGLLAFNFFEPLASFLEGYFRGTFLDGMEDFLALMLLFCPVLGGLRWGTNQIAHSLVEYHPLLQQIGAGLLGLLTGYILAGFFVLASQTLPWDEDFMGFQTRVDPKAPNHGTRQVLPPDRVWLAVMRRAGIVGFGTGRETSTFDYHGLFAQRYSRYRRYVEGPPKPRDPMPYNRELPP